MCKRSDGYYIKNVNPYQKLIPHIMPHRHDSMNTTTVDIRYKFIEEFIANQRKERGVSYNYMDVLTCALVRMFALRPSLNRFVMNKRIYQHYDITVSFAVKKRLVDNSEDTTVKVHFTGEETIDQIKEALNKVVTENTGEQAYNSVDKTAKILTDASHGMISLAMGLIKFLDKHNMLPKSLIETSPFHNSMFITYLKSINGDSIYHHCYDFGTTGVFLALGKEHLEPICVEGEVVCEKMLHMGVCVDERFCDGLYFVNSMRLLKSILQNPEVLLEKCEIDGAVENALITKETKQKYKQIEKERKLKKKLERKQQKMEQKEQTRQAK